jgi:collagen type VI alpha
VLNEFPWNLCINCYYLNIYIFSFAVTFLSVTTTTPALVIVDSCDKAEIDMVFILDASTSVSEPNFNLMRGFILDFLSESHIDSGHVQVGVVIYSTDVYLQFHLNTYLNDKDGIFDAVKAIPYRYGSTNTADALKLMRTEMFTPQNGDRPGVKNVCIIITDGVSNINARRTISEAEQAHAQGIHIYAIGIGLTDYYEVDGIATPPPEENRFAIKEFTELRGLEETVFASICGSTTPAPTTLPPTTERMYLIDNTSLVFYFFFCEHIDQLIP